MKKERLEKIQDILVILLNHLLFVAGVVTILDLFQLQSSQIFLWIGMIIIPFFLYTIRIIGKPKLLPAPCMIVGLGILSMLEKIQSTNDLEIYYLIFTGVYLIGYFIFFFIKRYMEFIVLNEKSAGNKAEQEIFQNGLKQTFLYCVGSLFVFMFAANLDWMTKIANHIGDWLVAILRQIFAGLDITVQEEVPQNVMQDMTSQSNGTDGQAMHLELSDTFLKTIIFIFIVVAIIAFIILMYLIYKYYRVHLQLHKKAKNENELQATGDIREKCEVVQKKKEKRENWFAFLNNREKVRKLYRKKILGAKKQLIGERQNKELEYLTAKECCAQLVEEKLQIVYEKARYSEKEIYADDVRQISK